MTVFDPNAFLNAVVPTANATRLIPVDAGEYLAVVSDGDKGVQFRVAKGYVFMDIQWVILDEAVKAKMKMDKVTVRQSMIIDVDSLGNIVTEENKNVSLGKLREALGQNSGPWSPAMLKGAGPARIAVTQRADDKDATLIYNDVAKVARAA